jgi:hypothetical protein
MPDDLSAFLDWFDQVPRTPVGVLVPGGRGGEMRVRSAPLAFAEWRSQMRGAVPQPGRPPRSPEAERRRNQLALMAYQLEKEARDES